ncbi:hypothetical protein CASFOL_016803 [Castilleja foliolosa]|uniref:Nucleocapsid protein n=1 Tax=Castilleja foliolosa TaxID=1961234 RepID=A0ABD3DBC7_9LAMI
MEAKKKYAELDNIELLTGNAPKTWSDDELKKIKVHKISRLTINEILTKGQWFINQVNSMTSTATVADVCLELALHIGCMGSTQWSPLLHLLEKDVGFDLGWESPKVTGTSHQVTGDLFQRMTKTSMDEMDANAICYLAAYCLRLYGKTEQAWTGKLALAKTNYQSWYKHESSVMQLFSPSEDQARKLRLAFNRKPVLGSTWVLTVAYNENRGNSLSKNHLGMLTYLACQMFSYTGMHAYSFIMQIHAKSGIEFAPLLKQLNCQATRRAVIEAENIINKFELIEGKEGRTTYFRYARFFDSGYFLSLQTSNCTFLAYVTAKTLQMLTPQSEGSNPLDVYALKNVGPAWRARMDKAAANLYKYILTEGKQHS